MKYFIVAGERSGDMHGSRLTRQLMVHDIRAEVVGVGGKLMLEEGANLLTRYESFSVMGIWEVVKSLAKVSRAISTIKRQISEEKPDVLILIDAPSLNLKMARHAKKLGIKVVYFISPKIWAWREHRIKNIKRDINLMLTILPFEVEYYLKHNYHVEYIGNPLIDAIHEYLFDPDFLKEEDGPLIAVLPGSRKQEIISSVNVIENIAAERPQFKFVIAAVDNVDESLYEPYRSISNGEVVFDKTYDILKRANVAVVTSGTATLETALLNCPQVVVYKTSPLSVFIARLLVKIKWISLVNLIADKQVVKELIQEEYNSKRVLEEIEKVLNDHAYTASMLANYQQIREKIGSGLASRKAAKRIIDWLQTKN